MDQHKVVYTSDIHGNETQYRLLADYTREISANSLIIGGDIAPKGFASNLYMQGQRNFLEHKLKTFLKKVKRDLPKIGIYLIMGNDDCSSNLDVLEKQDDIFHVIHNKRVKINKDFDIIGYSYVPITPFMIKDWEKFDLSSVPDSLKEEYENRKKWNYRLHGFKTSKHGWLDFSFAQDLEKYDSIQRDLSSRLFIENPEKTIYVIHAPPNNTNLDKIYGPKSVGSFAVRLFIEKFQPYITLHGHIHETVGVSGSYKDRIVNSIIFSSGNHNEGNQLAVVVFDLYKPQNSKRMILGTS